MGFEKIFIRESKNTDLDMMINIWNEVIDAGNAFPQMEKLTKDEAVSYFAQQSFTGVAENQNTGELLGLYVLHPNNIGRCGHIANASYAVKSTARGFHIGEKMLIHSFEKGSQLGFRILQFNAVVKSNYNAIYLYEKLGFTQIGVIPGGFLMSDGTFEDIVLFYYLL